MTDFLNASMMASNDEKSANNIFFGMVESLNRKKNGKLIVNGKS